MSQELEQRKLDALDELARIYARALDGLVDHRFEQAMLAVQAADPLVEDLKRLERELERSWAAQGQEPVACTKTAEVRALHQRLVQILQEQLGELDQSRQRMSVAKRVVKGYRCSAPSRESGSILDGTC
jgi:hypothetical protein